MARDFKTRKEIVTPYWDFRRKEENDYKEWLKNLSDDEIVYMQKKCMSHRDIKEKQKDCKYCFWARCETQWREDPSFHVPRKPFKPSIRIVSIIDNLDVDF